MRSASVSAAPREMTNTLSATQSTLASSALDTPNEKSRMRFYRLSGVLRSASTTTSPALRAFAMRSTSA